MNDQFKRENQVFKPNNLLVLLNCGVGKDLAGLFRSPPQNAPIFLFIFLFFWIILFFHCTLTLMNGLFQRENQVFIYTSLLVLLHCRVGKDWTGPFFPPPKCFDLSIYLSVFWIMILCHCILTIMNDRF